MMRLHQRRQIFPSAESTKAAAGGRERAAQTNLSEMRRRRKKKVPLFLLLVPNTQFFIFKGLADENAAVSEVNWVHNGAIKCCFVALLDLANG